MSNIYALLSFWKPYDKLVPDIKPGDLIEIQRINLWITTICHWAVAVEVEYDECFVVNLTDDGMVRRERLSNITNGEVCRINNSYDNNRKPFEATVVVNRALSLLGTSERSYDFFKNNCEHFAKECRNNDHVSHQVGQITLLLVCLLRGITKIPVCLLESLPFTHTSEAQSTNSENDPLLQKPNDINQKADVEKLRKFALKCRNGIDL